MKKILIFYGTYGGGHLSAARNLKDCIENNYPETEVIMIDCIEYINKIINKLSTKAYADMSKKAHWLWKKIYYLAETGPVSKISNNVNKIMSIKLKKLIYSINPDLIISTHPFSSQMIGILKMKGDISCKLATIMTDYAPHNQWLVNHEFIDYFFVAHEGMKEALCKKGVLSKKIFVTGIPLSNRFLAHYDKKSILDEYHLNIGKKTVLFFAGGEYGFGKDRTFNMLKSIIKDFSNMQIIAIAGKNEKMKEKFDELVLETSSKDKVKILSYTNQVPELMSVSDLVITKPGGLTTTECLASGLPIIIINPIPGQEEENAEFLEKHGLGIWIKSQDNISQKIYEIFNNETELQQMKIRARLFAKKNSTKDICEICFNSN